MLVHGSNMLRQALTFALSQHGDIQIAGELDSRADVLAVVRRERPDVVLLGCYWHEIGDVVELCEKICAEPEAASALVVGDRRVAIGVLPMLANLAPRVGILSTEDTLDRLIEALHQLAAGKAVIDVEFAVAALNANNNPLTDRERDVLRLAVQGAPAKDIAGALYLSTGTVRNYLSRIMAKTEARTRIEAIRRAQDAGWI